MPKSKVVKYDRTKYLRQRETIRARRAQLHVRVREREYMVKWRQQHNYYPHRQETRKYETRYVIYVIKVENMFKIGMTSKPERRILQYNTTPLSCITYYKEWVFGSMKEIRQKEYDAHGYLPINGFKRVLGWREWYEGDCDDAIEQLNKLFAYSNEESAPVEKEKKVGELKQTKLPFLLNKK